MKSPGGKETAAGAGAAADAGASKAPAESAAKPDDAAAQRLKALEEERDRLKGELADVRDKFLRSRADYENLGRRTAKEAADSVRAAKGGLLLRFVHDVEMLERVQADLERAAPEAAKGVRLVLDDLRRLLRDEGVKEIEGAGHPFNYRFHEAVDRVETDKRSEGTIVEVVQRGYLFGGEILRPALVKVAVPPKRAAARDEAAAAGKEPTPGPA